MDVHGEAALIPLYGSATVEAMKLLAVDRFLDPAVIAKVHQFL
ncbi:hypothetical protein [Paraburkholderia sp. GAS32]